MLHYVNCVAVAARLIKELADRFPAAPLMDALGMIYPQYWLDADCEANFKRHLVVVKEHYGYNKKFSKKTKDVLEVVREVDPVLSPATLDMCRLVCLLLLWQQMLRHVCRNPSTSIQ